MPTAKGTTGICSAASWTTLNRQRRNSITGRTGVVLCQNNRPSEKDGWGLEVRITFTYNDTSATSLTRRPAFTECSPGDSCNLGRRSCHMHREQQDRDSQGERRRVKPHLPLHSPEMVQICERIGSRGATIIPVLSHGVVTLVNRHLAAKTSKTRKP